MKKLFTLTFTLTFTSLSASAATCTPSAATDYYFRPVKYPSLIEGRVMGENGDYKLLRYEDQAWLEEAFAEREAMASYFRPGTNDAPRVVKMKIRTGTEGFYDADVTLHDAIVTNNDALGSCGLRPITFAPTNPHAHSLITAQAVMANFREVKRAKRLVKPSSYENINEATVTGLDSEGHTWSRVEYLIYYGYSYDINAKTKYVRLDDDEEYYTKIGEPIRSNYHSYESGSASGTKEVPSYSCDHTAWLRGGNTPRWAGTVSVWCEVGVSCKTNGTTLSRQVMLNAGAPAFVRAATNSKDELTWSIAVGGLAARAAQMAGLPAPGWESGAAAAEPPEPDVSDIIGRPVEKWWDEDHWEKIEELSASTETSDERELKMIVLGVWLVFDIAPTTSLSGW